MDKIKFRRCLTRIAGRLSRQDVESLKFICSSVVPVARMERVRGALDLFQAIEERGKMSPKELSYFAQILSSIGRGNLLDELENEGFSIPRQETTPDRVVAVRGGVGGGGEGGGGGGGGGGRGGNSKQEFLFKECLLRISEGLTSTELEALRYMWAETILSLSVDKVFSATQLFQLLQQRQYITPENPRALYDELHEIGRSDLCHHINDYLQLTGRREYDLAIEDERPIGQGGILPRQGGPHNYRTVPQQESKDVCSHTNHHQIEPPPCQCSSHPPQPSAPSLSPGRQGRPEQCTDENRDPPSYNSYSSQPMLSWAMSNSTFMQSLGSASIGMSSGGYSMESSLSSTGRTLTPEEQSSPTTANHTAAPTEDQMQVETAEAQLQPYKRHPGPPGGFPSPSTVAVSPTPHPQGEGIFFQPGITGASEISRPMDIGSQELDLEMRLKEIEKEKEREAVALMTQVTEKEAMLSRKEHEMQGLLAQLREAQEQNSALLTQQSGSAEVYLTSIRELEEIIRTKNKEVEELRIEMQAAQGIRPMKPEDFYSMSKAPHGICLIINNHKFYHPTDPDKAHNDRTGAHIDQYNLTQTFKYLRYKVEAKENLTADQMTDEILKMSQRDHSHFDSFVCCILTHGENDIVHGADSLPVNLSDLTGLMKFSRDLIGKPKLFFIQACRGDREDRGVGIEKDSGGERPSITATIPQEADFFYGYATPSGSAAYRSRRHGSWYISELCKVFTENAYHDNLSGMMKKVNGQVSQAFTKEGLKQCSEYVDRLRKEVHFFHFIRDRVHRMARQEL